jgi:type 1 fimbria pilin
MGQAFNYRGVVMSARIVRTVLATAVLAGTLSLTGCTADAAPDAAGTPAATQQARNDLAQDLASARQATLVPVAVRLELLDNEKQRALLAGSAAAVADVEQRIDAYSDLAASIEAAPSAETVRTLVDQAGLELAPAIDDSGVPTAVAAAVTGD